MAAIFINNITAGTTVGFTAACGTHFEGVAVRVGQTHPVESYSLPPSTPFVDVEVGDGTYRLGPVFTRRVTASQVRWVGL